LRVENERLTAYARELQERISTLVNEIERLRDLVQTLLDNDPNETVADNGMTVLDAWRDQARHVIRRKE
jgi:hypothetical protein